jgi:iron complex outermembrane receptor protein
MEARRGRCGSQLLLVFEQARVDPGLGQDGIFSVSRQPIEIEGLEANVAWRTPLPGLALSAAYAMVQGRTDSNDPDDRVNNDLDGANISPDRINLAADYRGGPFSARLQTRF